MNGREAGEAGEAGQGRAGGVEDREYKRIRPFVVKCLQEKCIPDNSVQLLSLFLFSTKKVFFKVFYFFLQSTKGRKKSI